MFPQLPQLLVSLSKTAQMPSQASWPKVQLEQTPATHTWLFGQMLPQAPQLSMLFLAEH